MSANNTKSDFNWAQWRWISATTANSTDKNFAKKEQINTPTNSTTATTSAVSPNTSMSVNNSQSLANALSTNKINSAALNHGACATLPDWVLAVKKSSAPNAVAVKTLVLKPKGIAGTDVLVVAARADAEWSTNPLIKLLGGKEARAAQDDLILSTLKLNRIDVSPFALANVDAASKPTLLFAIDKSLASAPQLAFRNFSASDSIVVSGSDLISFVKSAGFTPKEFDAAQIGAPAAAPSAPASGKAKQQKSAATTSASNDEGVMIGITVKKADDFPSWYTQVLVKTEMMDYYDVSGCYILRPWSFKIWAEIKKFFTAEIEELGVEECYFPMFINGKALEKEKDHVEGFAPEVAWVTRAGSSDLAEPIAVRPTSETIMYPAYAKWVQSHRDLPLRLNQWCNVVRWEFKNPQPFLRTREFLWQEGHTAFATKEESDKEVLEILELYRRVYEEVLAVPVVPGKKSENEKFAGGLYTTTVEGFIPTTGRAIQGATSHSLGQNFAKMFEISIESIEEGAPQGSKSFVWQNSWGLTTRTIGVMVMVHGDDKGLVLPPNVANIQVVVVPVGITAKTTAAERAKIHAFVDEVTKLCKPAGVRAKADTRDVYTPGYKFNHWEMRGVPIRLEVGPKDIAKNEVRCVIRHNGKAQQLAFPTLSTSLPALLAQIQSDMFEKAKKERDSHVIRVEKFEDGFVQILDKKNLILAPWCERVACEKEVKERSQRIALAGEAADEKAPSMGAKTLCIPFKQPTENPVVPGKTKCFACDHNAVSYTLWGRSY
ncbi:proline---tRNA ligase [Chytriomyces confervae]|uniref:proline--tRNA ligase n=1 Tax=Chytriomyces confervae TaxID=246404 RepID=A0A507FFD5_9FUNG|nr:proline---tRNA ligase [Chytriomyces confervae]